VVAQHRFPLGSLTINQPVPKHVLVTNGGMAEFQPLIAGTLPEHRRNTAGTTPEYSGHSAGTKSQTSNFGLRQITFP
jgi:hypothetical protein